MLNLLSYPDVTLARLAEVWPELAALEGDVAEQLEIKGLYAGYMKRQEADMRSFRKDEALKLPVDLNYDAIGGLSTEIVQKLQIAKPPTLGAAAQISGVTPAAADVSAGFCQTLGPTGGLGTTRVFHVKYDPILVYLWRLSIARQCFT